MTKILVWVIPSSLFRRSPLLIVVKLLQVLAQPSGSAIIFSRVQLKDTLVITSVTNSHSPELCGASSTFNQSPLFAFSRPSHLTMHVIYHFLCFLKLWHHKYSLYGHTAICKSLFSPFTTDPSLHYTLASSAFLSTQSKSMSPRVQWKVLAHWRIIM